MDQAHLDQLLDPQTISRAVVVVWFRSNLNSQHTVMASHACRASVMTDVLAGGPAQAPPCFGGTG